MRRRGENGEVLPEKLLKKYVLWGILVSYLYKECRKGQHKLQGPVELWNLERSKGSSRKYLCPKLLWRRWRDLFWCPSYNEQVSTFDLIKKIQKKINTIAATKLYISLHLYRLPIWSTASELVKLVFEMKNMTQLAVTEIHETIKERFEYYQLSM